MTDILDPALTRDIERAAVDLARLAGAEIVAALERGGLAVSYKSGDGPAAGTPVSDIDQRVEALIRAEIAGRFPDHGVIGEEEEDEGSAGRDLVWVLDPIDGTANFVSGYPLFSGSVGVLHRGRPLAGALWCSTGHLARAGVYHASEGGALSFDGEPLARRRDPNVRKRLAGVPGDGAPLPPGLEARIAGSAAIECAFVAAGLLAVARFRGVSVWDVAGGLPLVRAAGLEARWQAPEGWRTLDRFEAPAGGTLRGWRGAVVIGEAEAVEALCGASPPR